MWGVCNVYGPVQVDLKPEFLRELMEMILSARNLLLLEEILTWLEIVLRNLLVLSTLVWLVCLISLSTILA